MSASPATQGIWRYERFLPAVQPRYSVTLGESGTPLVEAPRLAEAVGIHRLYLKLENLNPTGSFKDRGTAVAVSVALEAGSSQIVEDSSGNAGASAAAYAARAGLRCTVFVPEAAPVAKLTQAEAYGARIVTVLGTRSDVAAAARREARRRGVFHLNHNESNEFVAGMRTLALELSEAFGGERVPPVVMPVGGGSLLAGCDEGFALVAANEHRPPPPQFAVQPDACAPLVEALERGWEKPAPVVPGPTVAGGITIGDPPRGARLLDALRRSGGAVAVADEAILRWGRLLAVLEGVYAEPTAAAGVAGLAKLVASGTIAAGGAAVVVVTGSGFKDPERSARI